MGFMGSGHSHPAFASFELDLDGRPVVVDPGTYTYAPCNPWRDHFRLMEMHNVVQIDGKHYFEPEGPFGWKQTEAVEELQLGPDSSVSTKFRYRIGTQAQPVQHVRTLRLESSRSASVRDEFAGTGRHRLAFWLHFLPGSRLFRKSRHEFEIHTSEAVYNLVLKGFGDFECRSWNGMEDFSMGWCSPRFNGKVASLTLCLQEDVQLPAERSFSVLVVSGPDVTTLPPETDTREGENPQGRET
jgi:Heparinase II/III-like protein